MCICAAPRTPPEGVIVYGEVEAKDFQEAKCFFEDRGVIFEHADTRQDNTNLERMIKLSGQQDSIVVEIGKKIFVGFKPDELDLVLP